MDLSFTKEQTEWREEVRDFLDQELPKQWEQSTEFCEDEDFWDFAWAFTKKVCANKWVGLTWPEEYGGLGRPIIDRLIMAEEFTYRSAPLLNTIGYALAAGALLYGGTHEQKLKFLPAIARLDYLWAEGYSEPDAGSDLASLKTTAVREGDEWIVNGQKTYTTWGSHADVLYLAARTDPDAPKHRGISIFCLDLKQPGISFGPQYNLGGGRQNHTFLDNVRVGHDMMIGEEGRGWDLIMRGFYGGGLTAPYMGTKAKLDKLVDFCKNARRDGRLLIDDPMIRDELVEIDMLVQDERLLTYESLSNTQSGRPPAFAGAIGAVVLKETMPRIAELANRICGPRGQIVADSPWAPIPDDPTGGPEEWFRQSFANHGNGTLQVKRMVLATRGLGLPR